MSQRLYLAMTVGLLIGLSLTSSADAQLLTYVHDGQARFSLGYPDGWEIRTPRKEGSNLISAVPTDGSMLWQGVWLMQGAADVDEAAKMMGEMELGLFQDTKPVREPWDEKVGDLTIRCHQGTGLYNETDTVEYFIALFDVGDHVGVLAYMGGTGALEAHRADLEEMVQSLELAP